MTTAVSSAPVKRTGIVHDRKYADHCTEPDCPERPERQSVLDDMLNEPDMQGLKDSVRAVLREMAGIQLSDAAEMAAGGDPKLLAYPLWQVRRNHGRYWKHLNAEF